MILSLENHCSIEQQIKMASMMRLVFKDNLLTAPLLPQEAEMPSPDQLKYKIIIKHTKLESEEGDCIFLSFFFK